MPTEPLLIRADASAEIGVGHVMRCVALAQAWQHAGGRVVFALAAGPAEIEKRLRSEGFEVVEISASPGSPDDAAQTAKLSMRCEAEWLVLDGYHFSGDYRKRVKGPTFSLLLMDDHGEFAPYKCDIVLNTNPYASDAMYPQSEGQTRFLLGSRYALLRREFLERQTQHAHVPEKVSRLLVTFGGADPHNVTLQVVEALQELDDPQLDMVVVVGASNPHRASLEAALKKSSRAARLLSNVDNMPEVISHAELAISAGGGTCYELAFMKVPMFLITMASNHERTVEAYGRAKAALAAGWFDGLERKSLTAALRGLIGDSRLRRELIKNARQMVDGRGAQRVVETMYSMHPEDRVAT
jgi:UDP-2,4-diacetamido-2,4,6-trideoxy-beta-L-altropyranose hydrolase